MTSDTEAERVVKWAHDDAVPLLMAIKATLAAWQMDIDANRHFVAEIDKSLAARATILKQEQKS
jgi:hypothetical protein